MCMAFLLEKGPCIVHPFHSEGLPGDDSCRWELSHHLDLSLGCKISADDAAVTGISGKVSGSYHMESGSCKGE